jgi:hypothetical protein
MAVKTSKFKNFSTIVTIDPQSKRAYRFENNEIKPHNLDKSSRNSEFFISYIRTKDLITSTMEISRSIPDSDLQNAVEIKAYDELGLDTAIEYKISFSEIETNNTKERLLNIFAIDASLVKEQFGAVKNKTRYIDYIATAPHLIRALYQKKLLDDAGVHCFVYFQKNDAFLALYKAGEYLYSKSLRYSLKEMSEKFCELIGERIDEEDFYQLLVTEGLKLSNPIYQEHLMKLFGDVFLYINDVLIFSKRSYGIDTIDKIYIGAEIGIISGIDEYSKSYLGLDSYDFNFNIAINSKEWYIDQMHILMVVAAQVYLENPDGIENFTIFKRPPAFLKRPSGKFFSYIGLGLLLAIIWPAYQAGYGIKLNYDRSVMEKEYKELKKDNDRIKAAIASLEKEMATVNEKKDLQSERLEFRKKLLNEIYDKKSRYPMKGIIIHKLVDLINKRGIKVQQIKILNDELTLSLVSSNEKRMTELLKDISQDGGYAVSTDKIGKPDGSTLYISDVSVKVK